MGLLDQVAGAVSKMSGQSAGTDSSLLGSIMQMLNNPQSGGLSGLVQSFKDGGLGDVVNSWISTGKNLPISADQIQNVLGGDQIKNLAGKLGISTDQVSGQLASLLPQVVDKLTPDGTLPQGDLLAKGMELLKGKF